ncbi:MAG: hypothetical protein LDL39_03455 [Magnetospirillum sp.]|nr:hypothetical protein [Magnetospirillum sp.]
MTSIVAVIVCLAMAEAVLWFVSPPPKPPFPKGMFDYHASTWRLTPNFSGLTGNRADFDDKRVTADADGRRIVPAAPQKAAHRLWLLGDSQTFGHGLADEETWANRLQEEFNRQSLSIKVVNLAVPAVNVDQYLARIHQMNQEIQAGDQVLVGLSWNDIITPQQIGPGAIQVVDGYLVSAAQNASSDSIKRRVALYDATGIILPDLQNLKTVLDSLSNTSALANFIYPRAKAIYYRNRSSRPLDAIIEAKVPEANFYLLSEMQAIVQARGASFTVLSLPDKIFFEDSAYAVYSVNGKDFPEQNFPGHVIMPLCEKFEIRCLDSFDVLRQHQDDPVAYVKDGHYNPKGAIVIAHWLASVVTPSP